MYYISSIFAARIFVKRKYRYTYSSRNDRPFLVSEEARTDSSDLLLDNVLTSASVLSGCEMVSMLARLLEIIFRFVIVDDVEYFGLPVGLLAGDSGELCSTLLKNGNFLFSCY